MTQKIVIAGFGDTGVLTAAHLKRKYAITAISAKPLLISGQELGSRLARLSEWEENYLMPFSKFPQLDDVEILQGKAAGIRPANNELIMGEKTIAYDVLVIASGTTNGFWRTAEIEDESTVRQNMETLAAAIKSAPDIAIIGGGPTAVSTASNVKEVHPEKPVHLFYPRGFPLHGYAEKTRAFVAKRLTDQGVELHPNHRAALPKTAPLPVLEKGTVSFETGQPDFAASAILWAVGQITPNNDFIPKDMLNADGYVQVKPTFQSAAHDNIFSIGDIAATDPNRSSARNMGYQLLAKNIDAYLSGRPSKMKPFKPPEHRWGSVLGIQNEGLRIFTPKGTPVRISPWWVKNALYPLAVDRMIYKGIRRGK